MAAKKGAHHSPKELPTIDIIRKYLKDEGLSHDPIKFYGSICNLLKQPENRVVRHLNTLMYVNNMGEGNAKVVFFSADPENKQKELFDTFMHVLRTCQYHTVGIQTKNTAVIKAATESKLQHEMQQMPDGKTLILVTL